MLFDWVVLHQPFTVHPIFPWPSQVFMGSCLVDIYIPTFTALGMNKFL